MRNSRRTYKNGKYGVANWENPLTRYNKLYEPFDPMKGQRKKHKKTSEIPFRSFCGEGGIRTPGASQLNSFQETVLEKNQIESANRDAAVSEIEDRSEEQKAVSTHERNPRRPESVNDREVEHVHDTTEHQRSVIEDHTVEKAVDDVAESAGGNQCETDQDSGRNHWSAIRQKCKPTIPTHRLADKRRYPPTEHTRQGDPEE